MGADYLVPIKILANIIEVLQTTQMSLVLFCILADWAFCGSAAY